MTNDPPNWTKEQAWPALPLEEWAQTYHTLHMWLQVVGKIRMELAPKENHWWHTALYVNARGLTTSLMPHPNGPFEIQFDFVDHRLKILMAQGRATALKLEAKPVSTFYREVMGALEAQGLAVEINTKPQEVPNPIPFDQDTKDGVYQPEYANRFWRILASTKLALDEFKGRFLGKCSPVHFFWGSFDLACTRFSGRRAPARHGVISSQGYSHECCSAGWWPGSGEVKAPAFYSYAYPEPPGFSAQPVRPAAASYDSQVREFILMYDDVRRAAAPKQELLAFCQSAYEAAANPGKWDRASLEAGAKYEVA